MFKLREVLPLIFVFLKPENEPFQTSLKSHVLSLGFCAFVYSYMDMYIHIWICIFIYNTHTSTEHSVLKTNENMLIMLLCWIVNVFYLKSEVEINLTSLLNTFFSSPIRASFDQIKISYETSSMAGGWSSSTVKSTCAEGSVP